MLSQPTEKQITLSLKKFIELSLGSQPCIIIDEELGACIDAIDKDNSLCYIEYRENESTKEIICRLWNPADWRTSIIKWHRDKERDEKERQAHWLLQANIELVAKALSRITALSVDEMKATAYNIIRCKESGTKLAALKVTLLEKLP